MKPIFTIIIILFAAIISAIIILALTLMYGPWVLIAFGLAMMLLMFILAKRERRKISKEEQK